MYYLTVEYADDKDDFYFKCDDFIEITSFIADEYQDKNWTLSTLPPEEIPMSAYTEL